MGLFAAAPEPCYFCGSPVGPSSKTTAWSCPACGCWNGRDRAGRIDGDHPAMRDSAMNENSFARRAHRSSARLPNSAPSSPFCHTCQANQTLVVNLLATYLPDEGDPAYADRLASLESYRASLYERYPPVCALCQPGVDAGLKRADQRAQAEAFGRALKRGVVESDTRRAVGRVEVVVWRARSVAWCLDVLGVAVVGVCAWLAPERLSNATVASTHTAAILALRAAAILWAAWDPTWLRRAREGRTEQGAGRKMWVGAMLLVYVLRLAVAVGTVFQLPASWIAAAAVVDITVVMAALTRRRDASPIQLTLVRPVPVEPRTAPRRSSHSLTAHPRPRAPASPPAPVFGQPSLHIPPASDEPMDWEPTTNDGHDWDGFGIGQQRMFEASNETGLEALLATWGLGADSGTTKVNSKWRSGYPSTQSTQPQYGEWNGATNNIFTVQSPIPAPTPSPNVLGMLRVLRGALLALRVLALMAALGSRAARPIPGIPVAMAALLSLEAAASTVTLGAVLVLSQNSSRAAAWTLAVLLAADAAARAAALFAGHGAGSGLEGLSKGLGLERYVLAPEIACAAWTVGDLVVLAAA